MKVLITCFLVLSSLLCFPQVQDYNQCMQDYRDEQAILQKFKKEADQYRQIIRQDPALQNDQEYVQAMRNLDNQLLRMERVVDEMRRNCDAMTNPTNLRPTDVRPITQQPLTKTTIARKSDVDTGIPVNRDNNNLTYALIIGNEDYSTYQKDLTDEVNVDFVENDAKIFKEYANKTLGIPNDNITLLINARATEMHREIKKLNLIAKNLHG